MFTVVCPMCIKVLGRTVKLPKYLVNEKMNEYFSVLDLRLKHGVPHFKCVWGAGEMSVLRLLPSHVRS